MEEEEKRERGESILRSVQERRSLQFGVGFVLIVCMSIVRRVWSIVFGDVALAEEHAPFQPYADVGCAMVQQV